MDALSLPRPSWMTEDLVLLEDQARRFIASEYVPHLDAWNEKGMYEREVWTKAGAAGLLCPAIPETVCISMNSAVKSKSISHTADPAPAAKKKIWICMPESFARLWNKGNTFTRTFTVSSSLARRKPANTV